MERQYKIFVAIAGGAFAALILLAIYNPFSPPASGNDNNVETIKAKIGQKVNVRYSSAVVNMIDNLPSSNSVEIVVSSELQVLNFAGLDSQIRYPNMEITYVQNGKEETVSEKDFKTVEYKFNPDRGNVTKYNYEDVQYISNAGASQAIVTLKPLTTAKVDEHYTIKMVLHTGNPISYKIAEKTIEIVA